MAVELAEAYVSIIPSARGFDKKLSDELDGPVSKAASDSGDKAGNRFKDLFSGHIGKLVATATAALGTIAVGNFLKGSVSAASDLAESQSKSNIVFGESSKIVDDFAKSAVKSLGLTRQQALESSATFGNLFTAMSIGKTTSADMSTKLVKLGSDLASFNNIKDPTEVLDALRSGLVGETEPLRKFGINLTDATLKAKAMQLGLSDGKGVLDANAKAQAAFALIMEQSTTAQGDFARTSGGLAGQQKILTAGWSEMQAQIGQKLLPVMTQLVSVAVNYLIPAISGVIDGISAFAGFLQDHQPVLILFAGVVAGVVVGALVAWVAANAAVIASTIVMLAPFVAVGAAIAALAAGVIYAYTHWGFFRAAVDAVASFMKDTLWPILQRTAQIIGEVITTAIGIAVGVIGGLIGAFQSIYNVAADVVRTTKGVFDDLVGFVSGLPGRIASAASGMWNTIKDGFRGAINGIIDIWNNFHIPGFSHTFDPLGKFGPSVTIDIPGIDFPNIPHLAMGGIVTRPTLALVGEAGPEAVIPLGSRGSQSVTVNMIGAGLSPRRVADEVAWALKTMGR